MKIFQRHVITKTKIMLFLHDEVNQPTFEKFTFRNFLFYKFKWNILMINLPIYEIKLSLQTNQEGI